ncbi:MAG: ATP-binding protein [Limnochordia bacterium]|nr:ATP-binding protein [Limnochordia bacterium]
MKNILVISGKGGTGKTCITSSFAVLAQDKVIADCDVDAANLHILLEPQIVEEHEFYSGRRFEIEESKCTQCGQCTRLCRFDAISDYRIDPFSCEGCAACFYGCPSDAILATDRLCGYWFISQTAYGPMVHARLNIAEENSGKLVTQVRQGAQKIAEETQADYVIIDGAPGIGCPVIASLSGVDLAVVVTEPTISGFHDLKRVVDLAEGFDINYIVCINKYDLDETKTAQIEQWCTHKEIAVAAKIPFDPKVVDAVVNRYPPVLIRDSRVSLEITKLWDAVLTNC